MMEDPSSVAIEGSLQFEGTRQGAMACAENIGMAIAMAGSVEPSCVGLSFEDFGEGVRVRYTVSVGSGSAERVAASLGSMRPTDVDSLVKTATGGAREDAV